MPEISAVIITFNEEANIERCLKSVRNVADEIIVVDSFSTDKTSEICSKYKARFVHNTFNGYIEQKNFALSMAKYPVVLSLDADEALSAELENSILKVKEDWRHDGYYCNRINNFYGKWMRHNSKYPDWVMRLFDKERGSWGGLNPHDRVELRRGSSTARLKGNIEHYSYKSISEHINKVNLFTDIAANAYYKNNISAGYLKIFIHPAWKFFRELIIRRGILDGYYGVVLGGIKSFETFLKYIKLRHLYRKSR
ncbi:MAG: glycosyltransferase family 2 protein [Bacteroidales bacterium]